MPVGRVLAAVDRRTPCGKRDYAILLLLATYGLRSREVAALTLHDIDWKRERPAIPERKAGHSTAFPLSGSAGEALADYLQHGRPASHDRHVFFRAMAPLRPIGTRRRLRLRQALPAEGRDPGPPSGLAHAAPLRRPATCGRRLLAEDDRGLRRAPLGGLDGNLRQLSGIASAGRVFAGRHVGACRIGRSGSRRRTAVTRRDTVVSPSDARSTRQPGKIMRIEGPPRARSPRQERAGACGASLRAGACGASLRFGDQTALKSINEEMAPGLRALIS